MVTTASYASPLTRRRLLAGGLALGAMVLPRGTAARGAANDGYRLLRARAGQARLRGRNEPPTPIWGYDGASPGPTLRVKQGEELKVRMINELAQPTTVHWHGVRLPNAMDGVPHLTQPPIAPNESFDYHFAPPDAGTYWYHAHFASSEQLARGLYGVLIVDEREAVPVDRDLVLVLADWRLLDDGRIEPGFGNMHDAMMAGRLGQYVTLNSEDTLDVPVRTNERLRLRLLNAANARMFQFRIARHRARIMAVDGQPCPPEFAPNGVLRLAPGTRIDLFLDATLEPGARAAMTVDDLRGGELEIGALVYETGAPLRDTPLGEPKPLPANPLATKLDIAGALKLDIPLDGGGMAMMMGGTGPGRFDGHGLPPPQRVWALAGMSSSGHDGPPLFKVERGRTVVLNFANRTAFPHAMHVHGHHFRQVAANGEVLPRYWLDTVVVGVREAQRIAFVADNPGRWMIHCHMIEHMMTGMAAWFEVT
jgi:FtsP/CotA-like multicopper oxidase with cupredoxin domain